MQSNRRFELPTDVIEEDYFHPSVEQSALFGPVARKTMLFVSIAMLVLVIVAILVSYPLTLIPFGICVYAFHQYRKMTKSPYRRRTVFNRKKH